MKSWVLFPGHINDRRWVLSYRLPGISPDHRELGTWITLSVIWLLAKSKDKGMVLSAAVPWFLSLRYSSSYGKHSII